MELHRYGDPDAFVEIFESFQTMVYRLALRMSADPEEAADCTQETFLRVHKYLASFRGKSTLKTWIYRIALNCCRSRLRRRTRRRALFPAVEPESFERVVDGRRSPETRTVDRDLAHRLTLLVSELQPNYREAVILRDLEGLTYEEIGAVLEVRPGTVRSRIARGRDRLRSLLQSQAEVLKESTR